MTIVRLPLILAVLGIAALLASACSESGRVELPAEAALLSEVKKLTASDAQAGNGFSSVAVSGDTAVAGADGAAYVFQRDQGGADNWGEVTKLTASDAQAGDRFGQSVALSGATAVVGAFHAGAGDPGAAYVFRRNQGGAENWGELKKLLASDAQASDLLGISAAVSGDTAVVGAYFKANATGAAYVFREPAPTPTPTPTNTSTPVPPTPIGGIGIFPGPPGHGADAGGSAVLSSLAAVAASAIALGGAAWYARRRWSS